MIQAPMCLSQVQLDGCRPLTLALWSNHHPAALFSALAWNNHIYHIIAFISLPHFLVARRQTVLWGSLLILSHRHLYSQPSEISHKRQAIAFAYHLLLLPIGSQLKATITGMLSVLTALRSSFCCGLLNILRYLEVVDESSKPRNMRLITMI